MIKAASTAHNKLSIQDLAAKLQWFVQQKKMKKQASQANNTFYSKDYKHPNLQFGAWQEGDRAIDQKVGTGDDGYWNSTAPGEFDVEQVAGPKLSGTMQFKHNDLFGGDGAVHYDYREIPVRNAVSNIYGGDNAYADRTIDLANRARATEPGFQKVPEKVKWGDARIFTKPTSQIQAAIDNMVDKYEGRYGQFKNDLVAGKLWDRVSDSDVQKMNDAISNYTPADYYWLPNVARNNGKHDPITLLATNQPATMYDDMFDIGNTAASIATPKANSFYPRTLFVDDLFPGGDSDTRRFNGLQNIINNVNASNLITKNSLPNHEFNHAVTMPERKTLADNNTIRAFGNSGLVGGMLKAFDTGQHTQQYKPEKAPSTYANFSGAEALQAASAGKHVAAYLYRQKHGTNPEPGNDAQWNQAYDYLQKAERPMSFEHGRLINYLTPGKYETEGKDSDQIRELYYNNFKNWRDAQMKKNKAGYSLNDILVRNNTYNNRNVL